MAKMMRKPVHPSLVLVFVTILYGANPIVVKLGIAGMSPILFTACRLGISVLAFVSVLYRSKTWQKVIRTDWPRLIKMGIEVALFQLGMIYALSYVSAAVVVTMTGLIPISTVFILTVQGREAIHRDHYTGALVTFLGVAMVSGIIGKGVLGGDLSVLLGIGLLFIAQFAAASYMVSSEKLLRVYSHYQVSALMFSIAFVLFLLISLPGLLSGGLSEVGGKEVVCMVYGGLISLFLANVLWIWGIQQLGSKSTVIFNNLPPVFALVGGGLILGEVPMMSQVIGVGVVLVGLWIFNGKLTKINP